MRTRVKICCIASAEEASVAIEAGADALGLVAAMPSGPGAINDQQIAAIAAIVPPPINTFLLTSEITAQAISAHVRATGPMTVQIVAHIDPAQSAELARIEPAPPSRAGDPRRGPGRSGLDTSLLALRARFPARFRTSERGDA